MIMRSLVLLGALFFWGNSFAQISLSVNKQTIKQIIPQIEKASGYNVFYTDKLPNLETKKDLNVSNASLEAVLKELFKGTKISFEIKANKQILLFQQTNKSVGAKKKVTGRIVDENDEPLIGASVIIKGSTQGTITNIDGEYTLPNAPHVALIFKNDSQSQLRFFMKFSSLSTQPAEKEGNVPHLCFFAKRDEPS